MGHVMSKQVGRRSLWAGAMGGVKPIDLRHTVARLDCAQGFE